MFECLFSKAGALRACIFIKKEIPTQVSFCEYCEIFKNSFLVQHFLFIILLRDDRILCTSLGTKLTCFIFLVLLLFFPSCRESIVIRTCFYTKISSKRNFRTHFNVVSSTILIESLKTRKNCRTLVTAPSNLLWKIWIWVFWILCFILIFLLRLSSCHG